MAYYETKSAGVLGLGRQPGPAPLPRPVRYPDMRGVLQFYNYLGRTKGPVKMIPKMTPSALEMTIFPPVQP